MTSDETVGEYLARARTLIKSKIKSGAMWSTEFDDTDAYHVCIRLLKTGLKARMLRRVTQFKSYKALFNHIKDKSEWTYFMEDNFAEQKNTQGTPMEVNEMYAWSKTLPEDQAEADMLAEVNEVYHRYGRFPMQCGYWIPGPRPQGVRALYRGGHRGLKPHLSRHTTVANQAYTFNGTTPHASINYTKGTFNMGGPFSTPYQAPYRYQPNQQQMQPLHQRFNSFMHEQNSNITQTDPTTTLIEQLQKLLSNHKKQVHQVNKVQASQPQPSVQWDLNTLTDGPQSQDDISE